MILIFLVFTLLVMLIRYGNTNGLVKLLNLILLILKYIAGIFLIWLTVCILFRVFYANTVTQKIDKSGNLVFLHPDSETQEIMEIITGVKKPSDELVRKLTILVIKEKLLGVDVDTRNISLKSDAELDQLTQFIPVILLPKDIKSGAPCFDRLCNHIKDTPKFDQNDYIALWQSFIEMGAPNIRLQRVGLLFCRSKMEAFVYLTNTIYFIPDNTVVTDDKWREGLIVEGAHATQWNEHPVWFVCQLTASWIRTLLRSLWYLQSFEKSYKQEYRNENSFEYEAHEIIAKEIWGKIKKAGR